MIPSKSWKLVDCRGEGRQARRDFHEKDIQTENPYFEGSAEAEAWENGFEDEMWGTD